MNKELVQGIINILTAIGSIIISIITHIPA